MSIVMRPLLPGSVPHGVPCRIVVWPADFAASVRGCQRQCQRIDVNVIAPGVTMQSVVRSLRVLGAVPGLQPVGLSELARRVGLPTSTAQRIMVTLAEAGWLRQTTDDTGR